MRGGADTGPGTVRTDAGRKLAEELASHPEMSITSSNLCSLHKALCERLDAHRAVVIVKLGKTRGHSAGRTVAVGAVLWLYFVTEPSALPNKNMPIGLGC